MPSRGFDPVVRILEYELSSSVFTLGGLDSGFLVWRNENEVELKKLPLSFPLFLLYNW